MIYDAIPGMIYVPIGYSHPNSANMNEIHGGSAWGAGTLGMDLDSGMLT